MCFRRFTILLASAVAVVGAVPAWSQTAPAPVVEPPRPALPATFARANDGRSTLVAVRLESPITLDGRLDEDVYGRLQPASGFFRANPNDGSLATEDTHVWIFFDDRNVYVGVRCFDSQPDRIVADEMRRDNRNIFLDDQVTVAFDTFYDRRTAYFFQTNSLGGVRDALIINENSTNYDWNTVWDVRSRRSPEGWTAEMVIPFKSLRYPRATSQIWGLNVLRSARSRNEDSLLSPPPRTYGGSGLTRLSSAATLVGIKPPDLSRNIELKPALLSSLTTNRLASPPLSNAIDGDVSLDAKYGITNNLTLDLTARTDFAQIEIDEQQVNLTRFSLLFPEKRDFFLEGQSVFTFGGAGESGVDQPLLFFSRRVGLEAGRPVPIQGGARLTGRVGRTSIGVLNIRTGEAPAGAAPPTNFFVARVRQDILERSSIGIIATRRTPSLIGGGSNQVSGADASLAFFANLQVNGYYARSATPGLTGDEESYRGQVRFTPDTYGFEIERLKTGDGFNPEIGFVRRPDVRRTLAKARFSPWTPSLRGIRQLVWEATYDRFVDGNGVLESRLALGSFRVNFDNSDTFAVNVRANYEFLERPFSISQGVTIPAGGYHFNDVEASYVLGPQRDVSGTLSVSGGGFFGGDHAALSYGGRVKVTSQLAAEPRVSVDWVDLPQGQFTTTLTGTRVVYAISPRMFVSGLTQYSSSLDSLETNVRFRWEYQPGSDLFVVYTDGRDTADDRLAELVNRGIAIKFTRLFRF